ncbi:methyltransferase regulatory domain-containing protein [Methylococcus sp. EFPC2]|uniref:methyltransferase regulatory domain-containing protein n=1 Tax=Methylococcus sp. EFPC2 TaxID=2812648 RepID=UPI001967BA19|nr:class I SAM-dependent methyltransferase [Methylococcus sp. EFPC2]QSA98193.1 class I SAM-dependent methyltransferase [Methylococcus sp. EFPC2]
MARVESPSRNTYDELPYESQPFADTHPDRLASLARLFGLSPAPVTACRVLELGCASGGNLIPMAFQLPGSEFVGVDTSRRQVEMAHETIGDLGLRNIRIMHASILDIDASWGSFDYIICHGVYSWVPGEVQDKILAVSAENLAPHGIAYVSYNTYPGWHMREMLRHMMRYHADQFEDTARQIGQARALVDFLANSVSTNDYYGSLLKRELDNIQEHPDWYLFHDHLELVNVPIYFYQFIERAGQKGLQYLAESDFSTMLTSGFPEETARTLKQISPNIIRTEQYMDFLRNRFFRQTLLCHDNLVPKRALGASNMEGFLFASALRPDTDAADLSPGVKQGFRMPEGKVISTDFPLTKAALVALGDHWPRALELDYLYAEAGRRLGDTGYGEGSEDERALLLGDLLQCYVSNALELHTWQADFTTRVGERPRISRIAAYQATRGSSIINQRHEAGELDVFARELGILLDGSRDRSQLLTALRCRVEAGELAFRQQGNPVKETAALDRILETALDETLRRFARSALLVE